LYISILEQFLNKNTPIVVSRKKDKAEALIFGGDFGVFLKIFSEKTISFWLSFFERD